MRKWKKLKIEELCTKVTSGGTPLRKKIEYYTGNIPWIKTGELKGWYINETDEMITDDAIENSSAKLYPTDTILIAMYGDGRTIGSVGITGVEAASNQACCAMIPNKTKCDPYFLLFALKNYSKELVNLALGGAQRNLNQKTIREFEIDVPNIEVQKRIGEQLSNFNQLIENNTRRIAILEKMARLIYREWFVHYRYPGHENDRLVDSGTELGEVPEGWGVKKLKDFIKFKNGKSAKNQEGDLYPTYGANGIIGRCDKGKWENGVIIGRVGAYCGEVEYCEGKFWASDNTIVATTAKYFNFPLFNYYKLEDLELRRYAGGSAQPLMTQTVIKEIKTILPSKDLLEKFQTLVNKLWRFKRNLEKKNQQLKETRDLLLPKLISGKVGV